MRRCVAKEVCCRFVTHLCQDRVMGIHSDPVHRLIPSFVRHVVGDESEVPVVRLDVVHGEHGCHLLDDGGPCGFQTANGQVLDGQCCSSL